MRSHIDGLLGYLAIGEENVAATVGAANRVADKVEGLNFSGYGSELNGSRGWRSRDPCEVPWLEEPFARGGVLEGGDGADARPARALRARARARGEPLWSLLC